MGWTETAIILVIILLFVTGGLTFFKSLFGPAEDAIKKAVGLADGLFSMLDQQIQTCKQNGAFAFWKGCMIGIGILGYLSAMGIAWSVRTYASFRKTTPGADEDSVSFKAAQRAIELGTEMKDLTREMRETCETARDAYLKAGGDESKIGPLMDAAVARGAIVQANEQVSHITDVAQRQAEEEKNEALDHQTASQLSSETEDYDERDREAARDAAKEIGIPEA